MDGWVGVSMWFETYSTLRYQILTFWLKIWYLWFCFPLCDANHPAYPTWSVAHLGWTLEERSPCAGSSLAWGLVNAGIASRPEQHSTLLLCKRPVKSLQQFQGLAVHFAVCLRLRGVKAATNGAASLAVSLQFAKVVTEQCRRGGDGVLDHGLGNRIRPARRGGDGHRDHLRGIGTPYRPNRRRDPPRVQGPGRR